MVLSHICCHCFSSFQWLLHLQTDRECKCWGLQIKAFSHLKHLNAVISWRSIKEYWKLPKRTRSCSAVHFRTYKLSSRSGIFDFCRCKCVWDPKVLPVTEWMRQLNWRWAATPGREGCVNGTNGLWIQRIDTSYTTWSAATVKVSLKAWIIFLDTFYMGMANCVTFTLPRETPGSLDQLELGKYSLDKVNKKYSWLSHWWLSLKCILQTCNLSWRL